MRNNENYPERLTKQDYEAIFRALKLPNSPVEKSKKKSKNCYDQTISDQAHAFIDRKFFR